jgi:hypothetical protein
MAGGTTQEAINCLLNLIALSFCNCNLFAHPNQLAQQLQQADLNFQLLI